MVKDRSGMLQMVYQQACRVYSHCRAISRFLAGGGTVAGQSHLHSPAPSNQTPDRKIRSEISLWCVYPNGLRCPFKIADNAAEYR